MVAAGNTPNPFTSVPAGGATGQALAAAATGRSWATLPAAFMPTPFYASGNWYTNQARWAQLRGSGNNYNYTSLTMGTTYLLPVWLGQPITIAALGVYSITSSFATVFVGVHDSTNTAFNGGMAPGNQLGSMQVGITSAGAFSSPPTPSQLTVPAGWMWLSVCALYSSSSIRAVSIDGSASYRGSSHAVNYPWPSLYNATNGPNTYAPRMLTTTANGIGAGVNPGNLSTYTVVTGGNTLPLVYFQIA